MLQEEYYENGKLEIKAEFKNGTHNGKYEEYYKNGNLYTHDINNPEEINEIGRFYIAKPRDVRNLERFGDNLYELKNLDELQDIADSNVVLQGFVQISNVNAVTEMVGLIETQRMVEMYQKVMTSHMEELNNDAITKLAATRA